MTGGQDDQQKEVAAGGGNGGFYNGDDLGKKLLELDDLVGQVEQPLHKDRFTKAQVGEWVSGLCG